MKQILNILLVTILCIAQSTFAQVHNDITSAFRQMKTISPVPIVVPTVVELPIETSPYERGTFAVYDVNRKEFTPYLLQETYAEIPVPVQIDSEPASSNRDPQVLVDNNSETSAEYFLQEERESMVRFTINANVPFISSSLFLELDQYVALPTTISISAFVDGIERTIVAKRPLNDRIVHFPQTFASNWVVTLTYAQPLRINELHIVQDSAVQTWERSVRFLAQPGSSYVFYHDADRNVLVPTIESGNLGDDTGVLQINAIPSTQNRSFTESDSDGDGIIDARDNCVSVANSDQLDIDKNGKGDACDDYDRDGLMQSQDNCPMIPNVRQEDTDGDGIGDVCDREESRLTEKYTWVPWAGMGVALFVLVILFILVATAPKKNEEGEVKSGE